MLLTDEFLFGCEHRVSCQYLTTVGGWRAWRGSVSYPHHNWWRRLIKPYNYTYHHTTKSSGCFLIRMWIRCVCMICEVERAFLVNARCVTLSLSSTAAVCPPLLLYNCWWCLSCSCLNHRINCSLYRLVNSPSVHGGLLCTGSRFSARRAIKGRSCNTCCYDIVAKFVPY